MKKEIIYVGEGILEQIKYRSNNEFVLTKEKLLEFAKEQDKEFEKKYPYCGIKNIATNFVLECLEYNIDTSAGHPTFEGDDIVRTISKDIEL